MREIARQSLDAMGRIARSPPNTRRLTRMAPFALAAAAGGNSWLGMRRLVVLTS